MHELRSGVRYDMPVVFGPSLLPDVTRFGVVDVVTVGYVTTRDAARTLVPSWFDVPDEPTVSVSRVSYGDVDYLAGRGYNELTVGISVRHGELTGSYMPVLWVDDAVAIMAGRELMGYAKLGGELPPVRVRSDGRAFEVSEYGTGLLRGEVSGLHPLTEQQLVGVRRGSNPMTVFGWKYIPGPGGTVDADYATSIVLGFEFDAGYTGEGHIEYLSPGPGDAPISARIVEALARLPMVAPRRAFVGHGSGYIDRAATRRLAPAGGSTRT